MKDRILKKEHLSYMEDKFRGFLATSGKDNMPRVVPVCFAYTNKAIYIPVDKKPKKTAELARIRDIRQNPRVSFIVDYYSNDWTKLSYMLVFAKALIVEKEKEFEEASYLILKRYPQYRTIGSSFYSIISLEPIRVKLWFFSKRFYTH